MKFTLFLKLENNINIYCNHFDWILDYGDKNNRSYFSTLDGLLDDLLERHLIENTLKKDTVLEISSLINLIESSRVEVRKDIESVKNLLTRADTERHNGKFDEKVPQYPHRKREALK